MKRLICLIRGHAEAQMVMLPGSVPGFGYSRIECRRCRASIRDGYRPTDEEIAVYNVWAVEPIER